MRIGLVAFVGRSGKIKPFGIHILDILQEGTASVMVAEAVENLAAGRKIALFVKRSTVVVSQRIRPVGTRENLIQAFEQRRGLGVLPLFVVFERHFVLLLVIVALEQLVVSAARHCTQGNEQGKIFTETMLHLHFLDFPAQPC